MIEYAVILSILAGASLTDFISIEPTWNVIFSVGGSVLFLGFFAFDFKLYRIVVEYLLPRGK